jgi:hypothetical protein
MERDQVEGMLKLAGRADWPVPMPMRSSPHQSDSPDSFSVNAR